MTLKNKIQIFLVTYNRSKKLKNTLDCLLDTKSPVKDFDITVLDNASTDDTPKLMVQYMEKYSNLTHVRHKRNIGGNANICRAFELGAASGKDYVWVLCDDDKYDFSNWSEVEEAIKDDSDIVCLSDYIFPTSADKTDPAYQIFQLTFVPAGIYKTSLITDTVLMNMYDSIYSMFQQSCLTIPVVNRNGKIHVCSKPLVFNGLHFEDKEEDVSYARGSKLEDCIARRRDQVWIVGYANILSLLKNETLRQRCLEVSIPYKDIYGSWDNFYNRFSYMFLNQEKFNYFYEVWNALPEARKKMFVACHSKWIQDILVERGLVASSASKFYLKQLLKKKITGKYLLESIFSIKNSHDKKYKIVKILGFRLKFKRIKHYTVDDIEIFLITHNRAHLITASLDSLLGQTAGVKKIVVLDNESTDDTEKVVKAYSKNHDDRVEYIKTTAPQGNYYTARKMASKSYCMLFHDDDILHPNYLEEAINLLNRYNNVSFITTRYTEFRTAEPTIQNITNKHYLFRYQNEFARHMYFIENIAYATAIYKTKYFKKEDLEYKKYNKFNDWPLMVKLARYGKSILFDDVGMFYIRRHAGQDTWTSTNTPSINQIINWDKCFYRVFKKFHDRKALRFFPIKAAYFLKGKYDHFLSSEDRQKYTYNNVITQAKREGLPVNSEDIQRFNDCEFQNYLTFLRTEYRSKSLLTYYLQSIFSIKNSHDKKYKIIKIFGIRIKIKRRKKKPAG